MKKKRILIISIAGIILLLLLPSIFFYARIKFSKPTTFQLTSDVATTENNEINVAKRDGIAIYLLPGNKQLIYQVGDTKKMVSYNDLQEVLANETEKQKPFIIIPLKGSSYQSVVEVLNEISVAGIKTYELLEPTETDERAAANFKISE